MDKLMTRHDTAKLIEEALAAPENREFAEAYRLELQEKQEQFRQSVPELVEALRIRGIIWPYGVHLGRLIRGSRSMEVVEAMLEAVGRIQDINGLQTTIGCLTYYHDEYNAKTVIEIFDRVDNPTLRREICEILPQTKARNTDAWARRVLTDPAYGNRYGDCRTELAFWSAELENTEGIADILVSIFEEMPLFIPYPLGQLAEERHLAFMRDRLAHIDDYPAEIRQDLRRNLTQAISKAEKRLAREAARAEKLALKAAEKQRIREEKQRAREEQKRLKAEDAPKSHSKP
jgi:hypothetical protein